ncbi:MAG TPA: thymidine kinase [Ktedonobacterales bacterium]|jgi:thymidine kinase
MAKLYFTHGTMGAQKTTDLLATAYNFEEHGGKVLITKPATDTKGDAELVSRIGLRRRADFLTTPDMDIEAEVLGRSATLEHVSAVLVDEAQFLRPSQVDQLLRLAIVHGIPVMTWGLRTDFRTHAFPGSQRLLEAANELRESIAMCGHGGGCEHRAQFNARLVNGRFVAHGEQVAIDGEAHVAYTALCARHYMQDVGPIAAEIAADADERGVLRP